MSDEPRIYVADLAAYNSGILHGVWIDVDGKDVDDIQAEIDAMLEASPDPYAEECAIHDWEGLAALNLSEFLELERIVKYCDLVSELEADIVDAALDTFGADYVLEADDPAEFISDRYMGTFKDAEEWAESYLEDTGQLSEMPDSLRYYFNFEAYARDAQYSGELSFVDVPGGVAVFSNR